MKWKDADLLAQEMYEILSQDQPETTGPMTINGNDGSTGKPGPPAEPDPFGGFTFPDMFLPDFQQPVEDVQDEPNNDDQSPEQTPSTRRKKTVTQTRHLRTVVPGLITGGSGTTYQVDLYPNGSTATGTNGAVVKKTVTATQLEIAEGETIPAGTWAMVFWHMEVQIITRKILESGGGTQGNRSVSTTTEVKVVKQDYEMQVPIWLSDVAAAALTGGEDLRP